MRVFSVASKITSDRTALKQTLKLGASLIPTDHLQIGTFRDVQVLGAIKRHFYQKDSPLITLLKLKYGF